MITGVNFSHFVNVEHDIEYSCEFSGCHEEGICRCGQIHNVVVKNLKFSDICKEIFDTYRENSLVNKRNSKINSVLHGITWDIDFYTVNRILVSNKLFLPQSWSPEIINGYYGQEIGDVLIESELAKKIDKEISAALDILDLSTRIEYLLELEYGGVLPELKNCSWEVIEIDKESLHYPSQRHKEIVLTKDLHFYTEPYYKGIRGIVVTKYGGYKLVDGYHRCLASKSGEIKVLLANKN